MRRSEGETPVGDDTDYGHGTPVRGGAPDAYDELEPVDDDTDCGYVGGRDPDAYEPESATPVGDRASAVPEIPPGTPTETTRHRTHPLLGGGFPVTIRQPSVPFPLKPSPKPAPEPPPEPDLTPSTTTGRGQPDSPFHPWRCAGMTLLFVFFAMVLVLIHRSVKEKISVFCTDLNGQMSRLGLTRVRALADTGSVDDTVQIESEDGDVIGMATCRLSGEFAAWYIEMQRRDVLTSEPSPCPPFALSQAAVSITGPRALVLCSRESILFVAGKPVASNEYEIACVAGAWSLHPDLIHCLLRDVNDVAKTASKLLLKSSKRSKPRHKAGGFYERTLAVFNEIQQHFPSTSDVELLKQLQGDLSINLLSFESNAASSEPFIVSTGRGEVKSIITSVKNVEYGGVATVSFQSVFVEIPAKALKFIDEGAETLIVVNWFRKDLSMDLANAGIDTRSRSGEYGEADTQLSSVTHAVSVTLYSWKDDTAVMLGLRRLTRHRPIKLFLPFNDESIYDKISESSTVPVCRSMDAETRRFSENLRFLNMTATGVWCASTRLRASTVFYDAAWTDGKTEEVFAYVDFGWLSPRVMLANPIGPSVVFGSLIIFTTVFVSTFVKDRKTVRELEKNPPRKRRIKCGSKNVRENDFVWATVHSVSPKKLCRVFVFRFKNEHRWASLFCRTRRSRFTTSERVAVVCMHCATVLALCAVFHVYGASRSFDFISVGLAVAGCTFVQTSLVAFLFNNSRSDNQERLFREAKPRRKSFRQSLRGHKPHEALSTKREFIVVTNECFGEPKKVTTPMRIPRVDVPNLTARGVPERTTEGELSPCVLATPKKKTRRSFVDFFGAMDGYEENGTPSDERPREFSTCKRQKKRKTTCNVMEAMKQENFLVSSNSESQDTQESVDSPTTSTPPTGSHTTSPEYKRSPARSPAKGGNENNARVFREIRSFGLYYLDDDGDDGEECASSEDSIKKKLHCHNFANKLKRSLAEKLLCVDYHPAVTERTHLAYSYANWVKKAALGVTFIITLVMLFLTLVYSLQLSRRTAELETRPVLIDSPMFQWLSSVAVGIAADMFIFETLFVLMFSSISLCMFR
eukprot:487151_1